MRRDTFSNLTPPCLSLRYDSLTGVPSCQRTLAFEKGSVLFNIGALYTQIGARQDRSVAAGIDKAIDAFQRAAGTKTAHTSGQDVWTLQQQCLAQKQPSPFTLSTKV